MSEEQLKEVNRLIDLRNKAVNFRKNTRDTEYINNEAHYEGIQWQLADKDDESPFIVKSDINHLKNTVQIRLGSLYANTYIGELKPLSPEDVESVETLNVLYQNEWKRLKIDDLIEDCIKSGAIFDNGYLEFNFNPNHVYGGTNSKVKGLITVKHIETASVYLDPAANNIDDCDYMVKRTTVTKEWLKREKPEWYKKLQSKTNKDNDGEFAKDADNGYIFAGRDNNSDALTFKLDTIYEKYPTKINVPIEGTEVKDMLGNIIKPAKMQSINVTRVRIFYLLDDDILVEKNEEYPFEFFNIVPFQWEKIPNTPYGVPLLRGLTVPQKMANLIESATNNIAMHYTVPTWLISDESGLDVDEVAELINAVGVVWKVTNIEGAIKQLEPPKLDNNIVAYGQNYVNYIREYGGANQAYQGNIGTAGATAQGANAAISRATIIDNDPLSQISKFVEKLTRVLLAFMVRYYKDDTFYIREVGEDGKYTFTDYLVKEDLEDVNFDFDVNLAARSKNDKNRQYNLTKEIYQLQNQYKDQKPVINVADVVKAAQLDNYNEIYKRLKDTTEESYQQKASLIVELIHIGNTILPNGQPLIDARTLQDGIIDVLDDNNNLDVAKSIINTYEQYQSAITDFKNNPKNQL